MQRVTFYGSAPAAQDSRVRQPSLPPSASVVCPHGHASQGAWSHGGVGSLRCSEAGRAARQQRRKWRRTDGCAYRHATSRVEALVNVTIQRVQKRTYLRIQQCMSERPKIHQEPLLCSGLGVSYRQVHVWLHRRDKFLRPSVTPQAPPPGAGRNHKPTSASGGGGAEVEPVGGRG